MSDDSGAETDRPHTSDEDEYNKKFPHVLHVIEYHVKCGSCEAILFKYSERLFEKNVNIWCFRIKPTVFAEKEHDQALDQAAGPHSGSILAWRCQNCCAVLCEATVYVSSLYFVCVQIPSLELPKKYQNLARRFSNGILVFIFI